MKKLTAILLSLILVFALTVPAAAASASEFLLQKYTVSADTIFCYGKQLPKGGNLEVSVDSRVLEGVHFSTLEQEHLPLTVYCLVDSATSLSDKAVQRYKDALLTLSSQMSSEDSMVLATIDGTFTERYHPKYCGGQGGRMYFAENNAYIVSFRYKTGYNLTHFSVASR